MSACGSLASVARDEFAARHNYCEGTLVAERPEFLPPHSAPTFSNGGLQAFELKGCDDHALYVCSTAGYAPSGEVSPAGCTPTKWCETPGCDSDVEGVARAAFVRDNSCPAGRVTAAETTVQPADAPADIAADPERLALWTQTQTEKLARAHADGATALTLRGCGATTVYACHKHAPGAPTCTKVR